jgi:hypothetical protein
MGAALGYGLQSVQSERNSKFSAGAALDSQRRPSDFISNEAQDEPPLTRSAHYSRIDLQSLSPSDANYDEIGSY